MQRLPLEDLLPGLLVVLVVDLDDVAHVLRIQGLLSPAPPAAGEDRRGGGGQRRGNRRGGGGRGEGTVR